MHNLVIFAFVFDYLNRFVTRLRIEKVIWSKCALGMSEPRMYWVMLALDNNHEFLEVFSFVFSIALCKPIVNS